MTNKCIGCGRFASSIDSVKCVKCTSYYHRACVNIAKDAQVVSPWLCAGCKAQNPRSSVRKEKADGSPQQTSPARADATSVEILQEIRLMRQDMRSLRDDFNSLCGQFEVLQGVVEGYECRMNSMEKRLESLENKNTDMEAGPAVSNLLSTIEQLKAELNARDQNSLINDVEISGIPEEPGENAEHLARVVADKLGITCEERDFVYVERVGMRRATPAGESPSEPPRPRLLVVRLARRPLRDAFLKAARVRRGLTTEGMGLTAAPTKLYVNERLSKYNRALYFQARAEARSRNWKYTWTRGGRVFVRRETGKASFLLRSEQDFGKVFGSQSRDNTTIE